MHYSNPDVPLLQQSLSVLSEPLTPLTRTAFGCGKFTDIFADTDTPTHESVSETLHLSSMHDNNIRTNVGRSRRHIDVNIALERHALYVFY